MTHQGIRPVANGGRVHLPQESGWIYNQLYGGDGDDGPGDGALALSTMTTRDEEVPPQSLQWMAHMDAPTYDSMQQSSDQYVADMTISYQEYSLLGASMAPTEYSGQGPIREQSGFEPVELYQGQEPWQWQWHQGGLTAFPTVGGDFLAQSSETLPAQPSSVPSRRESESKSRSSISVSRTSKQRRASVVGQQLKDQEVKADEGQVPRRKKEGHSTKEKAKVNPPEHKEKKKKREATSSPENGTRGSSSQIPSRAVNGTSRRPSAYSQLPAYGQQPAQSQQQLSVSSANPGTHAGVSEATAYDRYMPTPSASSVDYESHPPSPTASSVQPRSEFFPGSSVSLATAYTPSSSRSTVPLSLSGSGAASSSNQRTRNRLAATKCRAKAKASISKLEEDERIVSLQHDELQAYAGALRHEVLCLKSELLRHSDCGCVLIQEYVSNTAMQLGEVAAARCREHGGSVCSRSNGDSSTNLTHSGGWSLSGMGDYDEDDNDDNDNDEEEDDELSDADDGD